MPRGEKGEKHAVRRESQRVGNVHVGAIRWGERMLSNKVERRAVAATEFRAADKDGSGTLAKDEVISLVGAICGKSELPLPREARVLELFGLCDKNGDGELQEGEFLGYFKCIIESSMRKARKENTEQHIKEVGGAKNGQTRLIDQIKPPKYYPADDVVVAKPSERAMRSRGIAKLRQSLTPGTVVVLLAGRFRGRRAVFLKQLPSGLLLVTGPYAVNGVPVRRVAQSYVIATSAKVDIKKVDCSAFNDEAFGKTTKKKRKKGEADFFAEDAAKATVTPERAAAQKTLDDALMAGVKAQPMMAKYLKARFTLGHGDAPHKMSF